MFTLQNENIMKLIYNVTYYVCYAIMYSTLFYMSSLIYHYYLSEEVNNDNIKNHLLQNERNHSTQSWFVFVGRVCIVVFALTLKHQDNV
mgnify:CR=1 FL=1